MDVLTIAVILIVLYLLSAIKILREEGFIKYFKVVRAGSVKRNPKSGDKRDAKPLPHNLLIIYLKYGPGAEKVISGLDRVSRPGLRHYVGATEIPRVLGGLGVAVVSTSEGVMTGEQAKKKNLGGELLCYVW